ncbi:serine/threonine protein kinase [Alteromonadaceae bacterium M269]|nr:serine/threonine protein kinase [Alteromonadaceae bacterium M269]
MQDINLRHFYIPEEQSIYLLSHKDAQKLKDWLQLCTEQLELLGYHSIELIGSGAFGFAFAGKTTDNQELVFKFSRITLPQHIQDRLEEEAYMLNQIEHDHVPNLVAFERVRNQAIMVMKRASGIDLEKVSLKKGPLPARLVVKIAAQLADILFTLRNNTYIDQHKPVVHGDIKPSNIVFNETTENIGLIDWGSSVFAQLDHKGQPVSTNVMDLMSGDINNTNARLGDIYFIGEDQLCGELSSSRFDEQGIAGTLYALASGQSCRFGHHVITPESLGLPAEFAKTLSAMLSTDEQKRKRGGDYFVANMRYMKNLYLPEHPIEAKPSAIPIWSHDKVTNLDTVVYSSRKSFLRAQSEELKTHHLNDAQLERYYKNYLQGMGDTEKAFMSAVSRLGKYPVVGGLVVRWRPGGVYIDSSLNLYDFQLKVAFESAVENLITLARAIKRVGVFKSCMFNARHTLHIDRDRTEDPFIPDDDMFIPFDVSSVSTNEGASRNHSYFEDGDDPDELLKLPEETITIIKKLNRIHHTGCIIFEALGNHLKVHSYFTLLDHTKEQVFKQLLDDVIKTIPLINGLGISGFMKLPYKDTRHFEHIERMPDKFYPRNPLKHN